MSSIRRMLAVWLCKFLIGAGKLAGKKGSSTPGRYALMLYPNILRDLAGRVRGETIAVCGTNGKTTTNNLLYTALCANGKKVVCNQVGANMLYGIVTAFVDACSLSGRLSADYACIEIDEASAVKIFDHVKPDYMVMTNLFRDQLDRYGEIDITMDLLRQALAKTPDTVLVLNGDDPLCASFAKTTGMKSFFYGIDEDVSIALHETKEGRFCVFCGHELSYNYYHYSQLGDYRCEECGFARPALDFRAHEVDLRSGLSFLVGADRISVNYRGFYNIYNILAAYAVLSLLKVDMHHFNDVLMSYKPQIGRMEEFTIAGKPVILNLSKNPAGFNQAISTMLKDPRKKDTVIVLNDNAQDGRDISWIWDVDFERMADPAFGTFAASGIRGEDMAVRLKYAGIPREQVVLKKEIKAAIEALLGKSGEVLYVLVNYTPLFETQNILLKMAKERREP